MIGCLKSNDYEVSKAEVNFYIKTAQKMKEGQRK